MESISITKIKPAKYNPRRIDPQAFSGLCESLKKFGMPQPLVVNSRSGILVSGHQRLKAAESLGWTKVPVVHVDLSDAEEKALNVSLNNRHIGGDYTEGLSDVLEEIRLALGDDFMADLRLDEIEIPEVKIIPGEEASDEVPAPPIVPKSKLGDLWTLGKHRLLCGDSTDILAAERLMDGAKADMVFTDPPYGVSFQSARRTESKRFKEIKNDDTILTEWVNCLPVVSKGWVFVWTTWKVLTKWIDATAPIGELTNVVIWDKGGGGIGDLKKTFSTDYEIALVFNRGAELEGSRIGSVWSVGKDRAVEYVHPTQKPAALAEMAFKSCTKQGASVLDLFGGSGSTLIACEQTNRRCFMMELDPIYIDVILTRWAKHTGLDPVRDDGTTWSSIQGA